MKERMMKKEVKNQDAKSSVKESSKVNVKNMVQIGMLGALATILMIFQIQLPFLVPSFYKLDLSEIPVLIGAFAMGPAAGIMIEFIKVLLNFVIDGTMTMGIGELANFIMGVSFVVPASICYQKFHTRKGAIVGLASGTLAMTVVASILNAFVLLPAYAMAFGMEDMTPLIQMGGAVNPGITNLATFIFLAVAPFNLLKGIVISSITMLLYKKISSLLKIVK
ncbi:MAG: ECF transporter S component [Eubacteriales bacterium]